MRSPSKTNIWLNIKYSNDKIIHIFHTDTVDREILWNAVYLQSLQFVLWKESLNGYVQQFYQYQQNEEPLNTNKTSTYDVYSDKHKKSAGVNRLIGSQLTLMRDWLLFNAKSAIFQLYHDANQLIFNEMMIRSALL